MAPSRWKPVFAAILAMLVSSGCVVFLVNCSPHPPPGPGPATTAQTFVPEGSTVAIVQNTPTATPMPSPMRTPTPTPIPSPTVSPTPPPSGRVTTRLLNVRAGPGTEYDIVNQLPAGETFNVIARGCEAGEGFDWFLIGVDAAGQRWISGSTNYVVFYNTDHLVCLVPPPTPTPPGTNPNFRADRTTIRPGECTTLRWDVEGIREIHLDDWGTTGHNAQRVCPRQTQEFVITVVERDGRRVPWPLTIQVAGSPVPTPTLSPRRNFVLVYNGCIGGTPRGAGVVKGQVLDRSGRPVVNARVGINLEGNWWQSGANPARVNEAGWYEWFLSPGQRVNFVLLRMPNGVDADFNPYGFEVKTVGGCFQHVNFIEQ